MFRVQKPGAKAVAEDTMWPPEVICPWPSLLPSERAALGAGLFVVGALGTAASGWLMSGLLLGRPLSARTQLLFLSFAVTQLGRVLLAGFPFTATSALAGRWLFGSGCCQLFAFLRQFFVMAQTASLTLLAVERAIVSHEKFVGRVISMRLYWTSVAFVWLSSLAWSLPPLFSWGRYSCDSTGTMCDIDWKPKYLHYNLSLLIMGDLAPTILMMWCAWKALNSSKTWSPHENIAEQHAFCKLIAALIVGMQIFRIPQLMIQFMTLTGAPFKAALVMLAPLCSEASSVFPLLVCLAVHKKMRSILIGRPVTQS